VTINKNFVNGHKVKKSKIAAKLVKVAANKVGKGKAIPANGSVDEVHQLCQRISRVARSEFKVHR